jgi:hypothetical protein
MGYNKYAKDVYSVIRLKNAKFRLHILKLDYELLITDYNQVLLAVNKKTLDDFNNTHGYLELLARRRYFFRFNNNDLNEGMLDLEVRLFDACNEFCIAWEKRNYSIQGPHIEEFGVLFHEEGDYVDCLNGQECRVVLEGSSDD